MHTLKQLAWLRQARVTHYRLHGTDKGKMDLVNLTSSLMFRFSIVIMSLRLLDWGPDKHPFSDLISMVFRYGNELFLDCNCISLISSQEGWHSKSHKRLSPSPHSTSNTNWLKRNERVCVCVCVCERESERERER